MYKKKELYNIVLLPSSLIYQKATTSDGSNRRVKRYSTKLFFIFFTLYYFLTDGKKRK